MPKHSTLRTAGCVGCRNGAFPRAIAMAFQPIVDTARDSVFAYEALVRGPANESAHSVLTAVGPDELYGFDQACRIRAIEAAAELGAAADGASLSINFMPNAVYEPKACIRATLQTAARVNFPTDRLIFEITEGEQVLDPAHLTNIVTAYRSMGFRTAIDDFGAGHSNLSLLASFRPDIVKLDMHLIRGIDTDPVRRTMLRACVSICSDLGIELVAEGIETGSEYRAVTDLGVTLVQGYFIAKPGFMALPQPAWPEPLSQAA